MQTDPDKRRRLKEHYRQCDAIRHAYQRACDRFMQDPGRYRNPPYPTYPPYPADLRGLACGARTRRGTECKRTDLGVSGRCKFHGGMSTGPKTENGKAAALANLSKRWRSSEPRAAL